MVAMAAPHRVRFRGLNQTSLSFADSLFLKSPPAMSAPSKVDFQDMRLLGRNQTRESPKLKTGKFALPGKGCFSFHFLSFRKEMYKKSIVLARGMQECSRSFVKHPSGQEVERNS
jgi:hypothetical protein